MGYVGTDLSKLALFLFRFTGYQVCGNDGMCNLIVRQGPEGRRLNVSPARKGSDIEEDDSACPGLPWERRRCGTLRRCSPT